MYFHRPNNRKHLPPVSEVFYFENIVYDDDGKRKKKKKRRKNYGNRLPIVVKNYHYYNVHTRHIVLIKHYYNNIILLLLYRVRLWSARLWPTVEVTAAPPCDQSRGWWKFNRLRSRVACVCSRVFSRGSLSPPGFVWWGGKKKKNLKNLIQFNRRR